MAASRVTVPPGAVVPSSGDTSRRTFAAATAGAGAASGTETEAASRRPDSARTPIVRRRSARVERPTVTSLAGVHSPAGAEPVPPSVATPDPEIERTNRMGQPDFGAVRK